MDHRTSLLVVFVVLLSTLGAAAGFDVSVVPKKEEVSVGEVVDVVVELSSKDFEGNLSLSVVLDKEGIDLSWFNWSSLNVSLSLGEVRVIPLRVNVPFITSSGNKKFVVEAVSSDKSSSGKCMFKVFDSSPSVFLSSPVNDSFVEDIVGVDGFVSGTDVLVSLSVDSSFVSSSLPYLWNTSEYLDGGHVLSLTASSKKDSNSSSVFVEVDNTWPSVLFYSPLNGSCVAGLVEVDGSFSDLYLDSTNLSIDGVVVSDVLPYTWDTSIYSDGWHILSLSASDFIGHQSSVSNHLYVDNTPLSLSVFELTVNPTLEDPEYTLLGVVNKNASVYVNGVPVSLVNLSFMRSLTLHEGLNSVEVVALDCVGRNVSWTQSRALDGDRLPDWYELSVLGTDPLDGDSDDNNISDGFEDFDSDWVLNYFEFLFLTDPFSNDTDGDSLSDFFELQYLGSSPLLFDSNGDGFSDGVDDPDGDSLSNLEEQSAGSHPWHNDSDFDGLLDPEEIVFGSDPMWFDSDGDFLRDWSERNLGTDPLNNDSDFDGVLDGLELYSLKFLSNDSLASAVVTGVGDFTGLVSVEYFSENPLFAYGSLPGFVSAAEFRSARNFSSAMIRLYYPSSVNESNLSLFYWDPIDLEFIEVANQTWNPDEDYIEAEVSHFSFYYLFDSGRVFRSWDSILFDLGDVVRISVPVYNSGNDSAFDVRVGLFVGDPFDGGFLVDEDVISYIAQDSYEVASFSYTLSDDLELWVVADFDEAINESNEANNDAFVVYSTKDSDGDGLSDWEEVYGTRLTYPWLLVSHPDPWSVPDFKGYGLPNVDSDWDGVPNFLDNDSDNDGLFDWEEVTGVELLGGRRYHTYISDPYSPDTDRDGLTDKEEVDGWYVKVIDTKEEAIACYMAFLDAENRGEEPTSVDITEYIEEYAVVSNPQVNDSDLDGVLDSEERWAGLDPNKGDTDGDYIPDLVELHGPYLDADFFDITGPKFSLIDTEELGYLKFRLTYRVYDEAGLSEVALRKDAPFDVIEEPQVLPPGNPTEHNFYFTISALDAVTGFNVVMNGSDIHDNFDSHVINWDGLFVETAKGASEWYILHYKDSMNPFAGGALCGMFYGIGGTAQDITSIAAEIADDPSTFITIIQDTGESFDEHGISFPQKVLDAMGAQVEVYQKDVNPFGNGSVEYDEFRTGFYWGYAGGVGVTFLVPVAGVAKAPPQIAKYLNVLSGAKLVRNIAFISSSGAVVGYVLTEVFPDSELIRDIYHTTLGVAVFADTAWILHGAGVNVVKLKNYAVNSCKLSIRFGRAKLAQFTSKLTSVWGSTKTESFVSKLPSTVQDDLFLVYESNPAVVNEVYLTNLDSKVTVLLDEGWFGVDALEASTVREVGLTSVVAVNYAPVEFVGFTAAEFDSVLLLEEGIPGSVSALSSSSELSGVNKLVKVAEINRRVPGSGQSIGGIMDKAGASESVDALYAARRPYLGKGIREVIEREKTLLKVNGLSANAPQAQECLEYLGKIERNANNIRAAGFDPGEVSKWAKGRIEVDGVGKPVKTAATSNNVGNLEGDLFELETSYKKPTSRGAGVKDMGKTIRNSAGSTDADVRYLNGDIRESKNIDWSKVKPGTDEYTDLTNNLQHKLNVFKVYKSSNPSAEIRFSFKGDLSDVESGIRTWLEGEGYIVEGI
ncbi:MAG: hypothetical protein JW778_04520 [Candidatus Altiarchaeota archaeon]|nr:hypothetical protein [Candidatus Altiarchaeota archaeon]